MSLQGLKVIHPRFNAKNVNVVDALDKQRFFPSFDFFGYKHLEEEQSNMSILTLVYNSIELVQTVGTTSISQVKGGSTDPTVILT